jgi:hypothetical protein
MYTKCYYTVIMVPYILDGARFVLACFWFKLVKVHVYIILYVHTRCMRT